MNDNTIYLDYAAATPMDSRVLIAMQEAANFFANPSARHSAGKKARTIIEQAREKIANILEVQPGELTFTASGTESDNLAILGVAHSSKNSKKIRSPKIITSPIEHKAVYAPCQKLAQEGFNIHYLSVDHNGLLNLKELERAIDDKTVLVSIIYANNEVGTIQPLRDIANLCHQNGTILHSDACQAAGQLEIRPQVLGLDLLTLNASKIYGPRGIGLLYHKEGIEIEPQILGGNQELGLRSGTENTAAIVGFAKALELVVQNRTVEVRRLRKLRNYFIENLKNIWDVKINGHPTAVLANNISVSFKGDGAALLNRLDSLGVQASMGAACDGKSLDPSRVLVALGLTYEEINGTLRFSLGQQTTQETIDRFLKILKKILSAP